MKKFLLTLAFVLLGVSSVVAHAQEESYPWDKAPDKQNDNASLQNGAKLFVNYCLNCHSAAYMRYNRLKDIGLTEAQIKDNLLFSSSLKVGDTMQAAINPKQAKSWFGGNPPDLTLIARSRSGPEGSGADYLYTYLRTFYRDPNKATGWNNMAFPNVAMPHVLWELQGERKPIYAEIEEHGKPVKAFRGWQQVTPGSMSEQQYDSAVADLVNFLVWMGEPAHSTRVRVGVWVLLFLLGFTAITWRLNAAYWKDVK